MYKIFYEINKDWSEEEVGIEQLFTLEEKTYEDLLQTRTQLKITQATYGYGGQVEYASEIKKIRDSIKYNIQLLSEIERKKHELDPNRKKFRAVVLDDNTIKDSRVLKRVLSLHSFIVGIHESIKDFQDDPHHQSNLRQLRCVISELMEKDLPDNFSKSKEATNE